MGFLPFGPHAGDINRLDPWKIAKELGFDGKTVKVRIRNMEKQGFIQYYQIYPNFRLLGVEAAAFFFEAPNIDAKNEAIRKASLIDGVVEVYNFIGNTWCIDFTYHDSRDLEKRLSLLLELTKSSSYEKFYGRVMPPTNITLNSLDWKIMKSLRYNAFKRLSKVAEELGVTVKTIKRRFERMTSNNAIIIVPVINPSVVAHTITYGLLFYPDEETRREAVRTIIETFEPICFMSYAPPKGPLVLLNFATTMAETEEALLRGKSIKGVRDVKLLVLKETREYTEWIDREIDKRIQETQRPSIRVAEKAEQKPRTM